jgi:hypothetical protein
MSDPSPISRPGILERYKKWRRRDGPILSDFVSLREQLPGNSLAITYGVLTAAGPVFFSQAVAAAVSKDPSMAMAAFASWGGVMWAGLEVNGASAIQATKTALTAFQPRILTRLWQNYYEGQPESGEGVDLGATPLRRSLREAQEAMTPEGVVSAATQKAQNGDRLRLKFGSAVGLTAVGALTGVSLQTSSGLGAASAFATSPLLLGLTMVVPAATGVAAAAWRIRVYQDQAQDQELQAGVLALKTLDPKNLDRDAGLSNDREEFLISRAEAIGEGRMQRQLLGIRNTRLVERGVAASAISTAALIFIGALQGDPSALPEAVGPITAVAAAWAAVKDPLLRYFGAREISAAGRNRLRASTPAKRILEIDQREREFMDIRPESTLPPKSAIVFSNHAFGQRARAATQSILRPALRIPLKPRVYSVYGPGIHADALLHDIAYGRTSPGGRMRLQTPGGRADYATLQGEGVLFVRGHRSLKDGVEQARHERVRLFLSDHFDLTNEDALMLNDLSRRATVIVRPSDPVVAWKNNWATLTYNEEEVTELLTDARLARPLIGNAIAPKVNEGIVKLAVLARKGDPASIGVLTAAASAQKYGITDEDAVFELQQRVENAIPEFLNDDGMLVSTNGRSRTAMAIRDSILDAIWTCRDPLHQPTQHEQNLERTTALGVARDITRIIPFSNFGARPEVLEEHYDALILRTLARSLGDDGSHLGF